MNFEENNESSVADIEEKQHDYLEIEDKNLPESPEALEGKVFARDVPENNTPSKRAKKEEIDQNLYDEILEKLDIKKKQDFNQAIQEDFLQANSFAEVGSENVKAPESFLQKAEVERELVQNFDKIQKFVQAGIIDSAQGQNLKSQVLKKVFDELVQAEKIKRAQFAVTSQKTYERASQASKAEVFDSFSNDNPDFLNSEGRKEVFGYLKSSNAVFSRDELNKISDIVRIVEKNAIDRYLSKAAHEKTLTDSNTSAKQKLFANAQKSVSGVNFSRTFTREQIGKMSAAEFTKYETVIMEQLKKGRIK